MLIVSPTLLMLAIQLLQGLARDARMRDEAHRIQVEAARLVEDVERLAERAAKLVRHFEQAQEDVGGIATAAAQIGRRANRMTALDLTGNGTDKEKPRAAE